MLVSFTEFMPKYKNSVNFHMTLNAEATENFHFSDPWVDDAKTVERTSLLL